MSVLDHIRQAKAKFPKLTRQKAQGGLKWQCCNRPFRARTESNEQVWMSWCMWKRQQATGGMNRVVARAKRRKSGNKVLGPPPTVIKIRGKRMQPCK